MIEVARGTVDGQQQRVGVRRVAAVLLVALGLGACTSDDGGDLTLPSPSPSAAVASPSPEPVSSPSPEDPFAVPDEIDAAYVERVLNEIQRLSADVTRAILAQPTAPEADALPADLDAQLAAIYEEPLLGFSRRGRLALLQSEDERLDLLPATEFGQQVVTVEAVLATTPCISARVTRDFSTVDADPDSTASTLAFVFLALGEGANSTGWKLASLLEADISAASSDEEELRQLTAADLAPQAPEVCA